MRAGTDRPAGRALRGLAGLLAAALLSWPPGLRAACSLDTDGLRFGEYNPLAAGHLDAVGRILVACEGDPGPVTYVLRLHSGTSGSLHPRAMHRGSAALLYNLFTNPSRSQVWGDGSAGTEAVVGHLAVPASGRPASREETVYGRLFARQPIPPGAYRDLVQVTLEVCDTDQRCMVAAQTTLAIR